MSRLDDLWQKCGDFSAVLGRYLEGEIPGNIDASDPRLIALREQLRDIMSEDGSEDEASESQKNAQRRRPLRVSGTDPDDPVRMARDQHNRAKASSRQSHKDQRLILVEHFKVLENLVRKRDNPARFWKKAREAILSSRETRKKLTAYLVGHPATWHLQRGFFYFRPYAFFRHQIIHVLRQDLESAASAEERPSAWSSFIQRSKSSVRFSPSEKLMGRVEELGTYLESVVDHEGRTKAEIEKWAVSKGYSKITATKYDISWMQSKIDDDRDPDDSEDDCVTEPSSRDTDSDETTSSEDESMRSEGGEDSTDTDNE